MIELKNIHKVYNEKIAVKNVNLQFETGEFICFIGSSGSGKTTCMRMINGMNTPTKGDILIDGRNIKNINPVELRRHIGYVIQQIGLMPHMSVYDNIAMVPRLLKWPQDHIQEVVKEFIQKAGLPLSCLDAYPSELSGGQQQRIGVIRALAANQNIILMDEPFGALDPITRANLQELIKKLHKEMKKTIIFVTHDMDEALQLADRIVIMDKGDVIQFDTPANIMMHPANAFVRDMIGEQRLNQATFDYQEVHTIMTKTPVCVLYSCITKDALKLMREKRVDTLFVTDEEQTLMGMIDIFRMDKRYADKTVYEFIKEALCMHKDAKIRDAIHYIKELGYKNIPIIDDDGKLCGLVTRASIVDIMCDGLLADYEPSDIEESLITKTDLSEFEVQV